MIFGSFEFLAKHIMWLQGSDFKTCAIGFCIIYVYQASNGVSWKTNRAIKSHDSMSHCMVYKSIQKWNGRGSLLIEYISNMVLCWHQVYHLHLSFICFTCLFSTSFLLLFFVFYSLCFVFFTCLFWNEKVGYASLTTSVLFNFKPEETQSFSSNSRNQCWT